MRSSELISVINATSPARAPWELRRIVDTPGNSSSSIALIGACAVEVTVAVDVLYTSPHAPAQERRH